MKHLRLRYLGLVVAALPLGGCQLLGAGGSMIGSVFSLAMYLVAIAIPVLLTYYISTGKNPFRH